MCEALRKALPARKLPPVPSLRKTPRRAISSRAMWHLPPPAPAPRRTAFSILSSFLSLFSPYTINSGLYHNTFSHKKCHRRASLMAPEKMDCFTRSLFKMRPLFLRVARVFLFTGDVCGIDVRGGFRLGLTLCFDGCLDVLCVF